MQNKINTQRSNLVCVVIPVHQESMTEGELISFKQCLSVLKNRDIYLLCPKGLNLKLYYSIGNNFKVKEIDPIWQSSLLNYNKMKVSRFFYELFKDYKYLLTYELDAYIFKDDLDYWINKGYDYIGAPWFEGYNIPISDKLVAVGNSGFSLRNVQILRTLLKKNYIIYLAKNEKNIFKKLISFISYPYYSLSNLINKENLSIQNFFHMNEDGFISQILIKKYSNFKIAPIDDAYKFSFEKKPKILYERNNSTLPMGCHKWENNDINFWKEFIK